MVTTLPPGTFSMTVLTISNMTIEAVSDVTILPVLVFKMVSIETPTLARTQNYFTQLGFNYKYMILNDLVCMNYSYILVC